MSKNWTYVYMAGLNNVWMSTQCSGMNWYMEREHYGCLLSCCSSYIGLTDNIQLKKFILHCCLTFRVLGSSHFIYILSVKTEADGKTL